MDEGVEDISILAKSTTARELSGHTEDLFHVGGAIYDASKVKVAFIIFVAYILLNTDIFAESVLSKINKKTYDMSSDKITGYGIIVSAMMLSLFYILVDILATNHVI